MFRNLLALLVCPTVNHRLVYKNFKSHMHVLVSSRCVGMNQSAGSCLNDIINSVCNDTVCLQLFPAVNVGVMMKISSLKIRFLLKESKNSLFGNYDQLFRDW